MEYCNNCGHQCHCGSPCIQEQKDGDGKKIEMKSVNNNKQQECNVKLSKLDKILRQPTSLLTLEQRLKKLCKTKTLKKKSSKKKSSKKKSSKKKSLKKKSSKKKSSKKK